jgi:hypothetical protein
VLLLDYSLRSTVPEATLRVPSYSAWLESADQRPAYEHLALLMRVLSHQHGRERRWLLKTPHHLEWLDVLFAVMPGTKVIWTHRDPTTTVASFCSMIAHGRGVFSDEIDPHEIGRDWTRKLVRMIDRAMDARDRSPSSFFDVRYHELMADPLGVVRGIYAFLDEPLSPWIERRIRDALAAHPQHQHGRHRYRLADFGLEQGELRERFARYRDRFLLEESAPTS